VLYGLVGFVDDIWGDRAVGGFRGHLRLLVERGRLTTGMVKLAVGGGAALVLGIWVTGDAAPPLLRSLLEPAVPSSASLPPLADHTPAAPPDWLGFLKVVTAAAVIALGANTLNLFDLRPLRALKIAVFEGLLIIAAAALFAIVSERFISPSSGWQYWVHTLA